MTKPSINIMQSLGYLGLLPFMASVVLILVEMTVLGLTGMTLFTAYSVVILSFLSGVLWGNGIDHSRHTLCRNALILSNLFTLLAWAAFLVSKSQPMTALVLLSLGYLMVWVAELALRESEHEDKPEGYQRLRAQLTFGVIVLHGVVLVMEKGPQLMTLVERSAAR
ncbi:DUF3429 domain-containing protein [Vibrio ostreicida]|uniref:DUF3429 domain-containing protein n=1 Tax=Vibrio ostreicida TaxID=526588 RepID=A0ABT8BZ38_9VIBR|nr:DUF3429 domain-containing protein [Vibrio ostreicida]MDN3611362.1 DUF3429 domain-containing protein [Vibrio ostreicida]NPD09298.1 DUF3429 domain-containing protein [Vibrio ostreicida]